MRLRYVGDTNEYERSKSDHRMKGNGGKAKEMGARVKKPTSVEVGCVVIQVRKCHASIHVHSSPWLQ